MMEASHGTGLTNAQIFPETGERKENSSTAGSPGLVSALYYCWNMFQKGLHLQTMFCMQLQNLVKGDSLLLIIK